MLWSEALLRLATEFSRHCWLQNVLAYLINANCMATICYQVMYITDCSAHHSKSVLILLHWLLLDILPRLSWKLCQGFIVEEDYLRTWSCPRKQYGCIEEKRAIAPLMIYNLHSFCALSLDPKNIVCGYLSESEFLNFCPSFYPGIWLSPLDTALPMQPGAHLKIGLW